MIKLFISYRRSDSAHAAQRARACLQGKFGADAVFIDRDIPAGSDWATYLQGQLEQASDVIVLVGDAFLRELRRGLVKNSTEPDWLRHEIKTALDLKKKIYPVLIGSLDMPGASRLPEDIRSFASQQALFAREPAFDAAMAALAKSLAAEHGWVAPPEHAAPSAHPAAIAAWHIVTFALWTLTALLLSGLAGQLIQWLSGAMINTGAIPALWMGALYFLLTLLWGLVPYLVYRAVAEVRARARLPILNLNGLLTMVNLMLTLLAGGAFLLLSTRADWALKLMWVMPRSPHPAHYALQGVVLLLIVCAAVAVAMLEPAVRRWPEEWQGRGRGVLNGLAVIVMLAALWFAASLLQSLPELDDLATVPMVGYFMVAPGLSALVLAWDIAQSQLDLSGRGWRSRALFSIAVGLYLACTLGYFAHGPVQLFTGLGHG